MSCVRSMTGYGSERFTLMGSRFIIEVRAVNNRHLKTSFKLPAAFSSAQEPLRAAVAKAVARGTIEVSMRGEPGSGGAASLNVGQVRAYLEQLRASFPDEEIPVGAVLCLSGVVGNVEPEIDECALEELLAGFGRALEDLNESRAREGEELRRDILARVATIERLAADFKDAARSAPEGYFAKVRERVDSLLVRSGESPLDPQTVAREIALLADRVDTSEELVRLRSHCRRLAQLFSEGGAIGREADFVVQELAREANTMGAKTWDANAIGHVIAMKCEIEKIREQLQNVE